MTLEEQLKPVREYKEQNERSNLWISRKTGIKPAKVDYTLNKRKTPLPDYELEVYYSALGIS